MGKPNPNPETEAETEANPTPIVAELKLSAWPFYLEVIIKLGVVHFDFEVVSSVRELKEWE